MNRSILMTALLLPLAAQPVLAQTKTAQTKTTQAQTATTTLSAAVQAALSSGADVRTAQANLDKAQASLKATQADPSALVAGILQVQQAAALAAVSLQDARLSTLQSVVSAYAALYTAQQNVSLAQLQVQSDTKTLQVVQVKLKVRNATALDLNTAQSSLNASSQSLDDARAQVSIAGQKLAALSGLSSSLRAGALGSVPALRTSQASLSGKLSTRLPTLVQAQQNLDLAGLNVKLADNDFTPAQTLSAAKVTLANAQRSFESASKNALTGLSSAYQSALSTQQLLGVAAQKEANATTTFTQDQTRLKSGVISAVDLLKSQLTLAQAQQSRVQAQASAMNSLMALSVAAGSNLSGIGGL